MKLSAPAPAATEMTPVVALTAKVPFTLPLRIEKVSGKPCGSVALMAPMTQPVAALSGTLKEDAKTSGGLFTIMTVGVAEEEPLADIEDTPDELAVADVEAETVGELVAAPVATLDALAEAETVTLVVAVALLAALELVVAVLVALLVALALGDSVLAALLVAELNADELNTEVGELAPVAVPSGELVPVLETERDELAVADIEAETVAELVAAPVTTLDALAETETVTLELVVAVALLVALVNAESEEVLLAESEEVGVADVESKALVLAVALTVRDEDTVAELEADWVGATHVDVTLLHQKPGLHTQ